jgi:hypothetical protein
MSKALLLAATLGLLGACGPEDRQAPSTADFVIEKAPEVSGDKQVGVAGEPLPEDLRARVTRDGRPAAGVTVYWTTMQGTMDPPEAVTDAEGISGSRWTTKGEYLEQEGFASLDPVTGPRVPGSVLPGMIMYTALAYPDPDAPNTVLVNDNRFEPVSIAVSVGGSSTGSGLPAARVTTSCRTTAMPRRRRGHRPATPNTSALPSRTRASTGITARFMGRRAGSGCPAR